MNELRRSSRCFLSIVGALLPLAGLAVAIDADPVRAEASHYRIGGHGTDGEGSVRSMMGLGVPAYWAAGTPGGAEAFDQLVAASPTVDTVIVNGPASGPADPFDPELAGVIRRLRAEGVTVLGYVDTGYLGRTGQVTTRGRVGSTEIADWRAQARADAATWYDLYAEHGLGGIFFDQTPPDCGPDDEYLDAYGAITGTVWRRDPDAVVVINPGTTVQECYTMVADVIVIAEDSLAGYRSWSPPQWALDQPRDTFWHLVHGISTAAELTETLTLARERNAGQVYVTDAVLDATGGPWNTLPKDPYWADQVAAVADIRIPCR